MEFRYNQEKDELLRAERNIGFDNVIEIIRKKGVLDRVKHPNQDKYPNQEMFIIELNNYIYVIPFVIEDNGNIFLKTIIPSRKLNKKYKNK